MKVLWLSGNPSLLKNGDKIVYGGWIGALENMLSNSENVELGIAFQFEQELSEVIEGKTKYFVIGKKRSIINKLCNFLIPERKTLSEINEILKVIEEFKPDLIQVWGTEISYGLITKETDIPVVVHIQGVLNPISYSYLIPGVSRLDYILKFPNGFFSWIKNYFLLRNWKYNCEREKNIFQCNKHYIGRTTWDNKILKMLAQDPSYYVCNELLRNEFYDSTYEYNVSGKFQIISVLSKPLYKGVDLILRTALILKNKQNVTPFIWKIYGVDNVSFQEKLTGIKAIDTGIQFFAPISASQLVEEFKKSNLYVHPSYIDNSSNSICEAQYLGVPIIACNVGGVSTLIDDRITGTLVPANDPYSMAYHIFDIMNNPSEAIQMTQRGKKNARERHDKQKIVGDLIKIYSEILYCEDNTRKN
ncbi:MAG: glycosyltransferase [Breznakibacter sp.]